VNVRGGDDRFYNNVFLPSDTATQKESLGLLMYNSREVPLQTGGNVYFNAARPYGAEPSPLVVDKAVPTAALVERNDGVYLRHTPGNVLLNHPCVLVSTDLLGRAKISGLGYENPDGSLLRIDTDYFGRPRNPGNPVAGPFAHPDTVTQEIRVW
jgi:hypothetical protein